MAEENKFLSARASFITFCLALEQNNWRYKMDEDAMTIECGVQGEDLPIELDIRIDQERMLVLVLSHLPFIIPEDKRMEMAVAVSGVNSCLVDGCFDYDISSGHLFFRMTNSYADSVLGPDLCWYLLMCACAMTDQYNDRFLMLSKGMLSMEQFLKSLKK